MKIERTNINAFLDALATLDFKLFVSESAIHLFQIFSKGRGKKKSTFFRKKSYTADPTHPPLGFRTHIAEISTAKV